MRSDWRWELVLPLLVGFAYAWPTYVRYFGVHPGPLEEVTKLLPLPLLAWLAPGVVNSMRDGIVYGALGGRGFAVVEFGADFATSGYPDAGWADLYTTVPARWALGTESHIVWGATAGVGIGYVLSRRGRGLSLPIGLGIVALVALTHGFDDLFGK